MKIIMLLGPSNCGKTTTLNLVYDDLKSQGGVSTCKQQEGGNPNDFSDIIKLNGKLIAILTMGDYAYRIIDCIQDFELKNCDIFITACNDRFVKPQRLVSSDPNNPIIHKIPQLTIASQSHDNAMIVHQILTLI